MKARVVLSGHILIFLLLLSCFSGLSAAENEDFRFAEKLYKDGMFVAAAEEFGRFYEKYPSSDLCSRAMIREGEAWMRAGRSNEALETFRRYIDSYPNGEEICKARFYRGRVFNSLKMYQEAASEYLLLTDELKACPLVDRALLEGAEALLSAGNPEEAAKTLKILITERRDSELVPRAWYTLHLALINMGREMEAFNALEGLTAKYPSSPLSGMALLKLSERGVELEKYDEAESYANRILEEFEESAIREKARYQLIVIRMARGDFDGVLEQTDQYLSSQADPARKKEVFRKAIEASYQIERYEECLSMIDAFRAEFPGADSTGWSYIRTARILEAEGRVSHALAALDSMSARFPESACSAEVHLLKGRLSAAEGSTREAARFYDLALAEGVEDQGEVLLELARLYYEDIRDTLSAIRYWEEASAVNDGGDRERALFNAAEAKALIGDETGAAVTLRVLLADFPEGQRAEKAAKSLELLELQERPDAAIADKLGRIAASEAGRTERVIESGLVFLEANLPGRAIDLFEEALSEDLSREERAKIGFFLGKAYSERGRKADLSGEAGSGDLAKARSYWLDTARNLNDTKWGEEAHKAYLTAKFSDWSVKTSLERVDEFLRYYGESENRWWALGVKSDLLFKEARSGAMWAVDSAMTLCEEILSGSPPDEIEAETVRKRAYLYGMVGEKRVAARLLERYINEYLGDSRDPRACYDAGELWIGLKDFSKAAEAFRCCIGSHSGDRLSRNCGLRLGDCYYMTKDYSRAEAEYDRISTLYPGTPISDIADYRKALALERMNRSEDADKIYENLMNRKDLDKSLRADILKRTGRDYYNAGRMKEALGVYEELSRIEVNAENLMILAEVLKKTGDLERSEDLFTKALKFEKADTCSILAQRAGVLFRLGEDDGAGRDLELLEARCPGSAEIPNVLLEKATSLIGFGRFDEAKSVLDVIVAEHPGSAAEAKSLYYTALCYMESGGFNEAEALLDRFLERSPHSDLACMAYFKLAYSQVKQEKLNLAARNYSLASESCSDRKLSFSALKNLAEIYQRMEDYDKASSAWLSIVEDYPEDEDIVELLFNLGFSYAQSGKYSLAYDVYKRIHALSVDENQLGRAHYWAGICLKNMKQHAEAVREFLRVPYLRTGGMWGVTSKLEAAGCYVILGNYEEATRIYESIISSHGIDSDWGRIANKSLEKIRERETQQQSEKNEEKDTG